MTFSPVTFSGITFATKAACAPVVVTVTIKIEVSPNGCVKVTTVS